jgi:acyl-coenzyme A thioesterase PaaI-like protein
MDTDTFRKVLHSPWKFSFFTLTRLPMAWIAGIRLSEFDDEKSVATIRYKYWTKNPFRSIYFACLAMTAELSTGVLVMNEIVKSGRSVSMLVVNMNSSFHKKAVGKIHFTCSDGIAVANAIEESVSTGESVQIKMTSEGVDQQGDIVATFEFVWSVKKRS